MVNKGRIKFLIASAFACLAVALLGNVSFASWQSNDGSVYLTGWAENLSSVRLHDGVSNTPGNEYEKGDLQTFRNTLQIETTVRLNPNLEFFSIARGYYEASWDLDHGLPDTAEDDDASHRGDDMESFIDLREYYLTLKMESLTCKIGSQQVIWGESDALRMADIINPLDVSWHWVFESWEDIRIPLRMVNLMYEPDTQTQFRAQLIWIPEDFRGWAFAPEDAPWSIPGVPQVIWDQQTDELPDRHEIRNGEFGARIQMVLGGWELSLFDFYSRVDNAVYTFDPTHTILPLDFDWPQVNYLGGTFNVFNDFFKTVFRGECAFTMDQPYTSVFLDRIIEKDTFAFMLGFDRPTMWPSLNRKSFFISGQWFHKDILNYDSDIVSTDMSTDKTQDIATLLINTSYYHDWITPQLLVAEDFSGNGFFQPSIKYSPGDLWAVTLSANFIWGSADDDGYFGAMRRNDEIFLRLRIKF